MKTILEQVIELENEFKKDCAKEIAEYKAGKRSMCRMKVNFIKHPDELAELYNQRNDNDTPWFPPVERKKK